MSSYIIVHKYGSQNASTKTAGELKYCNSLGVFNKTIIPLALVGYETRCYAPHWLSTLSYPTRARGIIVKYTGGDYFWMEMCVLKMFGYLIVRDTLTEIVWFLQEYNIIKLSEQY